MKARSLTPEDEKVILDNVTEGYPVRMTQAGDIVRTISMQRIEGEEEYSNEVAGITLHTKDPENLLTSLRRHKYTKIEF